MENDILIIDPLRNQRDEAAGGTIHLRYQSQIIAGVYFGHESVQSNSVIGAYDHTSIKLYLSGRLGKQNYYHLVYQGIDKNYRSPVQSGISYFRDPEETIQNRTYLQLEKILTNAAVAFMQISYLQNETLLNRRYYRKTVVECGIKYTF